jgi:hypothetical protein
MATVLKAKGDALWKRDGDPGYRVGWRSRYGFEKSHLEGEMTYGEAKRKAAELQAADPERSKIFFAELILEEEAN